MGKGTVTILCTDGWPQGALNFSGWLGSLMGHLQGSHFLHLDILETTTAITLISYIGMNYRSMFNR